MDMTHKEWIRRCIEECKTCGNLNTASGAERLIEKFAGRVDETYGALSEEIAKVKGDGLVKTAIIKGDHYDVVLDWFKSITEGEMVPPPDGALDYSNNKDTFHCVNMTHEEALNCIYSGGVVEFVLMMQGGSGPTAHRSISTMYYGLNEYASPIEGQGTLTRAIEGMTDEGYAVVWGREGIFVVHPNGYV